MGLQCIWIGGSPIIKTTCPVEMAHSAVVCTEGKQNASVQLYTCKPVYEMTASGVAGKHSAGIPAVSIAMLVGDEVVHLSFEETLFESLIFRYWPWLICRMVDTL